MLGVVPAKNVLKALARYQAGQRDDFRDAEPGKIPHELRRGELAFFEQVPQIPYHGTADATPLFLILPREVWRWDSEVGFVREMEGAARRALGWILDHADRVNGYVAYDARSPAGLQNQGWKDSADSMLFRDGSRAEPSFALARFRATSMMPFFGPPSSPTGCGKTKNWLERFVRMPRLLGSASTGTSGWKTEATTPSRSTVPGEMWILSPPTLITSSGATSFRRRRPGSLPTGLWVRCCPVDGGSGRWPRAKGATTPVSTTTTPSGPTTNALIACGLRRYGFREEANRVTAALLDAAPYSDHRLPEIFAGYSREDVREPVELPRSCSPQAWAAGAVPLLVRTRFGVEPADGDLLADAVLPATIRSLRLECVLAFGGRYVLPS